MPDSVPAFHDPDLPSNLTFPFLELANLFFAGFRFALVGHHDLGIGHNFACQSVLEGIKE
jgi:hypothetical protein